MKKDLAKQEDNSIVKWDQNKWERVKEIFCPNITNQDFEIFMELSKSYELNPFKKEIWVIPFGGKAQIFAGRDGFLSVAHKTGMFDGMDTEYQYDTKGNLFSATCTVYNKSMNHPIKCKVLLREYSTGKNLWVTKPHIMLQKVAESSTLRRAFNINGIYSPEEMGDNTAPVLSPKKEQKETTEESSVVHENNISNNIKLKKFIYDKNLNIESIEEDFGKKISEFDAKDKDDLWGFWQSYQKSQESEG